ncbi:hypothetical protein [Nonomuraea dietziae]|uniref:hypothetical protein n=1 Tax=Nonomuraea dietziae TaxID=65515 RepID=UPI0031CE8912
MLSNEHGPACSLHPANGSSTGCADTSEQAHHHRLWTTRAAGKAWAAAANTGTNERLEPQ